MTKQIVKNSWVFIPFTCGASRQDGEGSECDRRKGASTEEARTADVKNADHTTRPKGAFVVIDGKGLVVLVIKASLSLGAHEGVVAQRLDLGFQRLNVELLFVAAVAH